MPTPRAHAIALHVEAAKRILADIDEHALRAVRALEQDGGTEFFAAVDERSRVLAELDGVVEEIARERVSMGDGSPDAATADALLADMTREAAAALESQARLVEQVGRERDRLAAAMQRASRPDTVAMQYATAVSGRGLGTFSVRG